MVVRRVLIGTATAAMVVAGAGAASAAPVLQPEPPDEGVMWPPEDTNGEWVPVPEDFYEPLTTEACDSQVTVAAGDVREAEYRARVLPSGETVVRFRGDMTADISRESDGATLDELDVSGPGYEFWSPDDSTVTVALQGPALVGPAVDAATRGAAEAAGLPALGYFEEGVVVFRLAGNLEELTVESAEVLDVDAEVTDVCTLLDDAAAGNAGQG